MKNRAFHFQLRKLHDASGRPLTVGKIAEAIFVNRAHLTDVLNNKPGHGGQTRGKVVKYLGQKHPEALAELLQSLQWDEKGELISRQDHAPIPWPPPETGAGFRRVPIARPRKRGISST